MKVLVTGGSGFIGSHLVGTLLNDNVERVIVFDRWLSDAIKDCSASRNLEFVQGDVRDKGLVAQLCEQVDIVYHLASVLGSAETIQIYDAEEVAEVNILGTLGVLKACLGSSVRRVIYPSTPDVPWLNPYKITKMACEHFCQMYFEEYGLNALVLKLPNVYGPRERWIECEWGAPYNYQKVVPTFILKALKNEPLPIFGDGSQRAVYMHVDDAVRAMVIAAHRDGCDGRVVPIGVDQDVSVNELARQIIDLAGSKSKLEYLPMRPGETQVNIKVDTAVAERLLGFTAKINLSEGLQVTIPYYSSLIDGKRPR